MTSLHRTLLTTSQKIECVAKALAGQEACGGIAGLSRSSGVSRPTVYAAKGAALEVLREHFEEPQSDPTVWVKVDPAQVRRTVVALRVMAPNALRPIEDMIPIIYPGVRLSYGKVQGIAAERVAKNSAVLGLEPLIANSTRCSPHPPPRSPADIRKKRLLIVAEGEPVAPLASPCP
jgi:hypothetical protein